MEELYLNDILIDLPEKSVAITYQINNLGELVNRQSNFSNSIEVPKTDWNVKTMDMLGVSGSTSIKPYRKIKAKYVVDGIELISAGTVEILETSKNYKIRIYDGVVEFIDVLEDKELSLLNWSAHNHQLTIDNYINSFSKTSGYIYADGIFYNDEYTNAFNLKAPSMYLHTLFDMIITQAGYTWAGSISTNVDFLKKVLPATKGYENNLTFQPDTLIASLDLPYTKNEAVITVTTTTYQLYSASLSGHYIYRLILSGNLNVYKGFAQLEIYKDSVLLDVFETDMQRASAYSKDISIVGSGVLKIMLRWTHDYDPDISRYVIDFGFTGTGGTYSRSLNSMNINFSTLYNKTKQVEIIKEVMNRYGLIFKQQRNSKHLIFKSMKELLVDRTNAEDWSDKFNIVNSENYNSGYAINNKFAYKYESGVEPFVDGFMVVDNEVNSLEKNVFSTLATASDKIGNYYTSKLWEMKKIDKIDTRVVKQDVLRIFNLIYSNTPFEVGIDIGLSSLIVTENVPTLHQQDMTTLIIENYTEFKVMLDRYKQINATLNLSLLDVYNLDFFKLKYINQLGKYYYLSKINNFLPDKLSTCELVEATDLSLLSSVDLIPPTDILDIWASSVNTTSLTLNWSESFDLNGVVYEVYKDSSLIATQSTRTYNFTGLVASTTYNFKVRAKDPSGNYSALKSLDVTTASVAVDTTPPAVPTGLASSSITSNSVQLNWTANVEGDLSYYKVYKNGAFLASPSTNSYSVTGLNSSTAYTFNVTAVDTSGNESALSSTVNVTTSSSIRAFIISSSGRATSELSCEFGIANPTKYHNGSEYYPVVGNTIYNEIGGTTLFDGGNLWWKIEFDTIKINSSGVVTDLFKCI